MQVILEYLKWTVGTFLYLFSAVLIIKFFIGLFGLKRASISDGKRKSATLGGSFLRAYAKTPAFIDIVILIFAGVFLYLAGEFFYKYILISALTFWLNPVPLMVIASAFLSAVYLFWGFRTENFKKWLNNKTNIEEVPAAKSGFDLIGGYDNVKKHLSAAVENIMSDKSRVKTNGILLYGPPGCGKTYFAEKTAEEFGLKYIKVHIDDIKSMWVNESASKVGQTFKQAIAEQPCVLVFEEIDELLQSRSEKSGHSEDNKVTNAFLSHMDDLRKGNHKVIVFGTTNYYEKIDKAAIRKGRFDYHIKIDRPGKEDVREIIKSIISKINIKTQDKRHSFVYIANKILNFLLIGLAVTSLIALIVSSFLCTDGVVISNLAGTLLPREIIDRIYSIRWLPVTSLSVFVLSCILILLKKHMLLYISNRISQKAMAENKKQAESAMQKIDIDRLSEHFEGRGASDIESAINMALVTYGQVTTDTILNADKENKAMRRNSVPVVAWDDVILNADTKEELQKITTFISNYKTIRSKYTQPLRGMILYGEPGTGKTLIARAIASNADCAFYYLKPSDIQDKYVGETEKKISEVYKQAKETAPSVVFIDEAEGLFERRDTSRNSDAVNQILQEIDGFEQHHDVVFTIMATNHPDKIDDAIKSRLSYSLHIPKPNKESREKLIRLYISKITHSGQFDYAHLAAITEGMSARDIENLINKASIADFSRPLSYDDIIKTIEKQKGTEKPVMARQYTWDDLVVSEDVLRQLKAIETIFKHPDKAMAMGIKGGVHAVFYGEPGTGKTHAARILANVLNADFKEYSGGEFKKGIVGETERMIRDAFKWLRSRPAAVMFIDEADAILMDRTALSSEHSISCVNQFLSELQGFEEAGNTYAVIISTNLLEALDPAVRSRFPIQVYFSLPSENERERLFKIYLKDIRLKNVDIKHLARATEGYSGRDIANLINTAKMNALSEGRDFLAKEDFNIIGGYNVSK